MGCLITGGGMKSGIMGTPVAEKYLTEATKIMDDFKKAVAPNMLGNVICVCFYSLCPIRNCSSNYKVLAAKQEYKIDHMIEKMMYLYNFVTQQCLCMTRSPNLIQNLHNHREKIYLHDYHCLMVSK